MSTENGKKYNLNDIGNAERLVDKFGDIIRYVPAWKSWLFYDGIRWVRVDEVYMNGLAKRVLKDMQIEANVKESDTEEEREQKARLVNWVRVCGYGGHTELMVKQARDAVLAQPEDFDSNPWLVNTESTTYNLLTGETHEHNPNDMITKLTGTAHKANAEGIRFRQFLIEVFNGDIETIKYVQKILGYSLSGVIREQHIFMPYGSGRNGKTVLFEIVAEVMGDYAAIGDTDLILDQGKFSNKNYSLANLPGTRMVVFAESNDGRRLNAARVKALSGGDSVLAEAKFQRPFPFRPQFKMFLYMNHLPVVEEVGDAIWERIRVIPFNRCFINGREDCLPPEKELIEKLQSEKPAILQWLIDGARLWQEEGLNEPDSVKEATTAYKQESDDLAEFLEEETVKLPGSNTKLGVLFEAYKTWLDEPWYEGKIDKKEFGKKLSAHGYKSYKSHGVMAYRGIALKSALQTQPEPMLVAVGERDDDIDED